jgi:hypothetical protein
MTMIPRHSREYQPSDRLRPAPHHRSLLTSPLTSSQRMFCLPRRIRLTMVVRRSLSGTLGQVRYSVHSPDPHSFRGHVSGDMTTWQQHNPIRPRYVLESTTTAGDVQECLHGAPPWRLVYLHRW